MSNTDTKSKPLLSSNEIKRIMKNQPIIMNNDNNNNVLKAKTKHAFSSKAKQFNAPATSVNFKAGYKLKVKYNPLYIQLHDKKTHTYVMYFQLLPTIGKDISQSNGSTTSRMKVPRFPGFGG